jgi:hypothetical protein
MTKEEQFVVNPLVEWFKNQKAQWTVRRPAYGTSATGWDLEIRRNKMDLLIEAKYIDSPFLSSFNGLVTAPLANRPQRWMATNYRSWCYHVCWAIGARSAMQNVYQILFDYLMRNPVFWKHYAKDLCMKYVFFVENGKVARIPFMTLLRIAKRYAREAENRSLRDRRLVAEELMSTYKHS